MKLRIGPPPFPNRKEHPFVASIRYKGLVIDIENLDGSTRSGTGPKGKPWKTLFKGAHYGEIRGSKGTDGDLLDVYIKANPTDTNVVYVVHQNHPGNHPTKAGQFDEDKCVIGASSLENAKEIYLRHYDRKDYLRSVTEMPFSKFKKYIFGENKSEKVADMAAKLEKLKKKETQRKSLPPSPSPSKDFFRKKVDIPFRREKKRGTPFIRTRLKGAEMHNEKLAEAYEQGVFMALEEHGLVKEGEISLSALKKQTQGPAAGITPSMMKSPLTPSLAAPKKIPTPASRIATPSAGARRSPAPVPKLPTVAGK